MSNKNQDEVKLYVFVGNDLIEDFTPLEKVFQSRMFSNVTYYQRKINGMIKYYFYTIVKKSELEEIEFMTRSTGYMIDIKDFGMDIVDDEELKGE